MPSFLTVKEASLLIGKSPSSIRRVIYPIIHDDKHADRDHIQRVQLLILQASKASKTVKNVGFIAFFGQKVGLRG